jgi:DNA-binding NarL/FixJ family response regulator
MEANMKMCNKTEIPYEQKLDQSYAESAYHALPFALCVLDLELKILWSNGKFKELLPTGDVSHSSEILRTLSIRNLHKLQNLLSAKCDKEVISAQFYGREQIYLNFQVIDRAYDQYVTLMVSESETLSSRLESTMNSLRDIYGLSETEVLIARLIAEGNSTRKIANMRQVSVATVRSQLRQLREKMGVCSSLEIAAKVFCNCLSSIE